jgi:class 3 adenylate cyclase
MPWSFFKGSVANSFDNIGNVYAARNFDGYDAAKAEEFLLKALAMNTETGTKRNLYEFHKSLAELYKQEKRWEDFAVHFQKFYDLEKEVQSEESKKQANLMEQRRQAAEREKEIALAKAAAAAELSATTALLHRVLPESIATRMIEGEERIADYFTSVSILFADMVGFTALATEVPPDIVVDLLNYVFNVFDGIMKRHGCEKVKTIGDGYMAVSGAPEKCEDHAERIARAALEMMDDIHLPEHIRAELPAGTKFNLRIGIHTGGAVCGVMGRERFVWDVYSDAVNIAARMESNGEPGKIHVSKDFAWLLRSRMRAGGANEFTLAERGEVEIKGKGMMKTYFLEKAQ